MAKKNNNTDENTENKASKDNENFVKIRHRGQGYWSKRASIPPSGAKKAIETPDYLWMLACQYFNSIDENPFLKQELTKFGQPVEIQNLKPYTWAGLEDYLFEKGIISTLQDYKSNRDGRYDSFVEVVRAIDNVIYNNKFEGAAVNAFNSNIIARDLGLVDKSAVQVSEEQPLFDDIEETTNQE